MLTNTRNASVPARTQYFFAKDMVVMREALKVQCREVEQWDDGIKAETNEELDRLRPLEFKSFLHQKLVTANLLYMLTAAWSGVYSFAYLRIPLAFSVVSLLHFRLDSRIHSLVLCACAVKPLLSPLSVEARAPQHRPSRPIWTFLVPDKRPPRVLAGACKRTHNTLSYDNKHVRRSRSGVAKQAPAVYC